MTKNINSSSSKFPFWKWLAIGLAPADDSVRVATHRIMTAPEKPEGQQTSRSLPLKKSMTAIA